ncbi:MAG: homoserine O-acetyltransferase [Puniceicoccales bacterium]|jgi:homoserine O-acetyltransferase|nr:homoserine O-acetyltransferase [Puniceicoccales bacterium]
MTDDEISNNDTEIEGSDVGLVSFQDHSFSEPFAFDLGGSIPSFNVRYETYGELNQDKSNAILVCHALTGDHHVAGRYSEEDRKPGWWNLLVGPGRPLDTNKYFVIGTNCLGGCQGTTGPGSINPATGAPYYLDFPQLTLRDMVRAQYRLVSALGIKKLHAVIGGSMGGMQALLWGIEYPDAVNRIVALACSARQNAQAIAFNEVGRSAILQDPGWENGRYQKGQGPQVGLAVARMMAHITYLSDQSLERKFGRERRNQDANITHDPFGVEFEVESYLRYQGKTFINRFDANSYLYITKANDRFDLSEGRSLEEAFAPMKASALIVGFSSDWLYSPRQNREIALAMLRAGKSASYAEIEMDAGHDSFLLPSTALYRAIRVFMNARN